MTKLEDLLARFHTALRRELAYHRWAFDTSNAKVSLSTAPLLIGLPPFDCNITHTTTVKWCPVLY